MNPTERSIRAEQADWLHRTGPGLLVGHLLSAAVLVWLLWELPALRQDLVLWLLGMGLVQGLRWLIYTRYRADSVRHQRAVFWMRWFAGGAALSGIIWGGAGWYFFHPTLAVLFPMALVLAAQVSLSVPTAGVYFPAHAVFNLLTMTPFLVRNLLEDSRLFYGQSFALVFLMLACLVFAHRQQATICEAIRLRLVNLDLLAQLTRENDRANEARQQAEEANTAKSRFLAAASHDLRQPLQALTLFVQSLVEDSQAAKAPSRSLVTNLASSADSLKMLLDSLLDLSHAEAGALKLHVSDLPLRIAFDRIRREFADQARAQGLRLRVVPTRYQAYSDPIMLERMLRNLVVNALRYTENGAVMVVCRRRGDKLRIEVRDSGMGIPEAARQSIFQEFYQLGNPERDRHKGLGLGLAIVNTLARQLGHRIELRSAPGRGSVFVIEVPMGRGLPQPKAQITTDGRHDHLQGRWLAVIDDDALVREALVGQLGRWGCHAVCGESADEVIAAWPASALAPQPAAILADRRLREGRLGDTEVQRLRTHFGQPIPAVLITGDTALASSAAGLPVLHKPIQAFQLRTQLEAMLGV